MRKIRPRRLTSVEELRELTTNRDVVMVWHPLEFGKKRAFAVYAGLTEHNECFYHNFLFENGKNGGKKIVRSWSCPERYMSVNGDGLVDVFGVDRTDNPNPLLCSTRLYAEGTKDGEERVKIIEEAGLKFRGY